MTLLVYKATKIESFTESKLLLKLYKTNSCLKVTDFETYMRILNSTLNHKPKTRLLKQEIKYLRDKT